MFSNDPNSAMQLSPEKEYLDGLVQDCSNSSALVMELLQSCTKLSKIQLHFPGRANELMYVTDLFTYILRWQLHFPVRSSELMDVTDLFTFILQAALLSMVQS